MAGLGLKRKAPGRSKWGSLSKKRNEMELEDLVKLRSEISDLEPTKLPEKFHDLPISVKTKRGLSLSGFTNMTEIQHDSIGYALQGNDILGAAKTGSGKTLAFLVPVLENLYHARWTKMDGVGALIITPTRELAFQIFDVLKKVGRFHEFSAGLVIGGGRFVHHEANEVSQLSIIIATPGRLVQHLHETYNFDLDSLNMLVLDEADRCLDLGFAADMKAIITSLSSTNKQTLLYSATQTKAVSDLAKLSLKNPVFVSAHEKSQNPTPDLLKQTYMVCQLHDKLNMLYSFLRTHASSKVLVFVSTCKQARFITASLKLMKTGLSIETLHGAMKQFKRVSVYEEFCARGGVGGKERGGAPGGVLISTDVAARGLDFPNVDWVIQLDAPESVDTYIHRVGRTARMQSKGWSLLFLCPIEEQALMEQLAAKRIHPKKLTPNEKKLWNIAPRLAAMLPEDPELKEQARGAVIAYLRCVRISFGRNPSDLGDLVKFAESFGLTSANAPTQEVALKGIKGGVPSKKTISDVKPNDTNNLLTLGSEDDEDDQMFTVKPKKTDDDDVEQPEEKTDIPPITKPTKQSKAALAKKLLKSNIQINTIKKFDSDDEDTSPEDKQEGDDDKLDLSAARRYMSRADEEDKKTEKERVRALHLAKRLKLRKEMETKKEEQRKAAVDSDEEDQSEDDDVSEGDKSLPDEDVSDDGEASDSTIPSYHESEDEEEDANHQRQIAFSDSDDDGKLEEVALQLLASKK